MGQFRAVKVNTSPTARDAALRRAVRLRAATVTGAVALRGGGQITAGVSSQSASTGSSESTRAECDGCEE